MSIKISTLLSKVDSILNKQNASIIMDFCGYMQYKGSSENHQINNLKVIIDFARFIGSEGLYSINKKEQIISFLNTKIKDAQQDPDKRWVTTWNHYLNRIKLFFRWLYNAHNISQQNTQSSTSETYSFLSEQSLSEREWSTPDFVRIKQRTTKRLSPYIETEIWERDELLAIVKYMKSERDTQQNRDGYKKFPTADDKTRVHVKASLVFTLPLFNVQEHPI